MIALHDELRKKAHTVVISLKEWINQIFRKGVNGNQERAEDIVKHDYLLPKNGVLECEVKRSHIQS